MKKSIKKSKIKLNAKDLIGNIFLYTLFLLINNIYVVCLPLVYLVREQMPKFVKNI